MPRTASRAGLGAAALAVLLILVILGAAFLTFTLFTPARETQTSSARSLATVSGTSSSSSSTSTVTETITTTSSSASASTTSAQTLVDPPIRNGTRIVFPQDYVVLSNYSLGLINGDRAKAGASPVSPSPIQSGQQHADSMLHFGYFSHWDTQGYKPYMRYTLLGGPGGTDENVAYEYFPSHFQSTTDVEQAISRLENQMIYNDSACCQNGHRDNILQPLHNRVSLGIAYSDSYVYFVEDFENYYINLSQPVLSGNTVRLAGQSSTSLGQIAVYVFYDKYPQLLTPTQLSQAPYQGSYDQGKFTGGVVPPCLTSCLTYPGNITVHAQTWRVSPTSVDIVFSMSEFTQRYGRGVYTVIVAEQAARPVILYSLSVFVGA